MPFRTRREPDDPREIGAVYAVDQIESPYFLDWVHEQMAEAERMRQADPNSVLPLETPADTRKVARNMLQQLEWDTKRELNVLDHVPGAKDAIAPEEIVKAFYEGFDEVLRDPFTVKWLADILLETNGEARGSTVQEAGRRRQPPNWMPPPAAPAPEWESKPRGAERVSIRKETESFSRTGFAFRAYYEDGTPLNIGGETYDETVRAVMAAWPNTTIVPASNVREAYRGRRRYGDSDAVIKHKQYEEEWQRKSAEYRAKVEPLKAGLVKINGQDLRSRGLQIPSRDDEILIASLSDPRKGNEPVAHFWQYPGFGYGEDGGLGQTYFVDPAIVPTGKETRETYDLPRAKHHRKGIDYYETAGDAQKVRNHILPQYPEARVVRYELGWAVQLYKSGPYYPEPAIVPAGKEARSRRPTRRSVTPYYSRR